MSRISLPRVAVLGAVLVLGSVAIGRASRSEPVLPRESFATFPMAVGEWQGRPADRFDQRVLSVLGVDEYINRIYTSPQQASVGLYVGFYQSQRQGDTIHSPLNCLPGAGWEPVRRERLKIQVRSERGEPGDIEVNRFTIQRGPDRQVVLYWYQSHGRVVASEYWGKMYTVIDAIRSNRTDAAMIRVISPIRGGDDESENRAQREVVEFTQALFPLLGRYLPD